MFYYDSYKNLYTCLKKHTFCFCMILPNIFCPIFFFKSLTGFWERKTSNMLVWSFLARKRVSDMNLLTRWVLMFYSTDITFTSLYSNSRIECNSYGNFLKTEIIDERQIHLVLSNIEFWIYKKCMTNFGYFFLIK